VIGEYLPEDELLTNMMKKSYDILNHHPLNIERAKKGLNKANSIWFWGAGTKPALSSFEEKTGLKGAMISAVDLLKGIAVGAGMKVIEVEGADGTLHTNYEGKAMAGVNALLYEGVDFAYIHVEAPDEMGHQGSLPNKLKAIEELDQRVIRVVKEEMDKQKAEYRMLIMPDHPTPIHLRTHTSDPVPYMLYDSTKERSETWNYNELEAKQSGNVTHEGYKLIDRLFERE
jgi:2,3-bisphosphoglycerate-independent phosphoglycerate mutase